MNLKLASVNAINYACKKFHYSKRVPILGVSFNIYNKDGDWCGVIMYGYGANKSLADNYNLWNGEVLELTRVALNGKQEYTSKALGLSLRLLKKYCPFLKMVVSYADIDQNHIGTIYQATNWDYLGERTKGQKVGYIINNKFVHNRSLNNKAKRSMAKKKGKEFITKGKRLYVYFLDRSLRTKYEKEFKKYCKNYAEEV